MLQSIGSQGVRHDLATEQQQQSLSCFIFFTYPINSTSTFAASCIKFSLALHGVASISLTGP